MLTRIILPSLLIATMTGCGTQTPTSSSGVAEATASTQKNPAALRFKGTDDRGQPCTAELRLDDQGLLKGAALGGTYTVNYKIPAPLSGLYGEYRMPGTFDSTQNIKPASLSIKGSWLGQDTVLSGTGKPLFWDTPDANHKLTVTAIDIKAPESITYASVTKIAGILPFVTIDLSCEKLSLATP